MDSATVILALAKAIAPELSRDGGRVDVASDPDDALEMLAASKPQGYRVVINWAGDDALDPFNSPGITTVTVAVTVQAGTGLKVQGGDTKFALIKTNNDVRRLISGADFNKANGIDCGYFRFNDAKWLEIEDLPTHQITNNFKIIIHEDKPTPIHVPIPTTQH